MPNYIFCGLIFLKLGFLNTWKWKMQDPQLKDPHQEFVLRTFTLWKSPLISVRFEPTNLGSQVKHITLSPSKPIWNKFTFTILW